MSSDDFLKSNRGGNRPGSGAPSSFSKGRPKGAKNKMGSAKDGNIKEYVPKINPLKELEGLYKELKKVNTKDELVIVQAKIDLLNKMLPYVEMKKPTASLTENDNAPTTITISDVKGDGGDVV